MGFAFAVILIICGVLILLPMAKDIYDDEMEEHEKETYEEWKDRQW